MGDAIGSHDPTGSPPSCIGGRVCVALNWVVPQLGGPAPSDGHLVASSRIERMSPSGGVLSSDRQRQRARVIS